jgi:SAM-dependent methyltransferase
MSDSAPQIKGYYEGYWTGGKAVYSGSRQGYAENFRRWMASEIWELATDAPVLEVGCGDASFTRDLAQFSTSVIAIDISAAQIAENSRTYPRISFLQHDVAEPFPFPDSAFEVIWCSEVLEHLFNPVFAVEEMFRILRPGGKLLVTVPYHGWFKDVLIALFKWDEHFSPTNPHIRFYTRSTLGRMVENAGFASVRIRTCGMGIPVRDAFVPTNILLSATKLSASEP